MGDFFFSADSMFKQVPYLGWEQAGTVPNWGLLVAFLLLVVAIDLLRLARAYRLAGRPARQGRKAVLLALPASLLSCIGGLLLSLMMGVSVMVVLRVVAIGVLSQVTELGPSGMGAIVYGWITFGVSLALAIIALFTLRSRDVDAESADDDDPPATDKQVADSA